jgi:hypothetical protein
MKRTQLNIALAVVAVGLGAAVFFSQKKEAPKGAPLTTLKADAITRVVIAHPGKPEIKLEKSGSDWKLTAPVSADADSIEVNSILALAGAETKSTLDPAQINKAELGLDPPLYTVTLNDVALGFGTIEPLKYLRYVETGQKIVLIDDPNAMPLDEDYSDLVSKALLPSGADIDKIELPGLTVARAADGKGWTATASEGDASADALQKFVDAWRNEHSMWNQLATDTPKGDTVTVTLKGGTALQFLIVSRDPQFVLERPDLKVRYTLSKDDAGKLLKLPAAKPAPDAAQAKPPATAATAKSKP